MILMSDIAGGDDDDGMKIILHAFFFFFNGALCCQCRMVAFVAERKHKTLKRFDDRRPFRVIRASSRGRTRQDTNPQKEDIDVFRFSLNLWSQLFGMISDIIVNSADFSQSNCDSPPCSLCSQWSCTDKFASPPFRSLTDSNTSLLGCF